LQKYIDVSALTSFITNIFLYPIDTLRRRYQLQGFEGNKGIYNNSFALIKGIYTKDGALSLYKGLPISVVRMFILL